MRTRMVFAFVALLCAPGFNAAGQEPAKSGTPSAARPASGQAADATAPKPRVHRIIPGDVLEVKVYEESEFDTRSRVNLDGTIDLYLLGAVPVAGKTRQEAAAGITALLKADYLVNPIVSLAIAEYGKIRFSVLGQVQKPGDFLFPSNQPLNILQAIAMAGGYTRIGNGSRVTVKREVKGKPTVITVNAKAMAKTDAKKVFEIKNNDVIHVGESFF